MGLELENKNSLFFVVCSCLNRKVFFAYYLAFDWDLSCMSGVTHERVNYKTKNN